ncbi:MAG: hypothetical protein ACTSYU_05795 [Promethearchaeota archaeon]
MRTILAENGDILPEGVCHSIFCLGTGTFRISQSIPRAISGFQGRQIRGVFPIHAHTKVETTGGLTLICLVDSSISPDSIPSQRYLEFESNVTELELGKGTLKRIDLVALNQEANRNIFTLNLPETISVKLDTSLVQATFQASFPRGIGVKEEDYVRSYPVNLNLTSDIVKCLSSYSSSNHLIGMVLEKDDFKGKIQSGIGVELPSGVHHLQLAEPTTISHIRFIGSSGTKISLFSGSGRIIFPALALTTDIPDLHVDLPPLTSSIKELTLKSSEAIYFEVGIND